MLGCGFIKLMRHWYELQNEIQDYLDQLANQNCIDPFFRGHSDYRWKLKPGLARRKVYDTTEGRLHFAFKSLGSHLLPPARSSWDSLFLMQHHGLPTRLLDWTESFAVALYFALKNATTACSIWILNPYLLNKEFHGHSILVNVEDTFPKRYDEYFIDNSGKLANSFPHPVVAIGGKSCSERIRSQRAVFTLHGDLSQPLEKLCPDALKKFTIPKKIHGEVWEFLSLVGINEFTVFPDLDGLSRYIIDREF